MTRSNNLKHLVLGMGQVGQAIKEILEESCEVVHSKDTEQSQELLDDYDVLHICYPPSESFVTQTALYQASFLRDGGLTIIHSTVAMGTSDQLKAVHHPIRGIHPNLVEGIRAFVNFFGGERAFEAVKIFIPLGIDCRIDSSAKNTEAMKLWDTTQYGAAIKLEKEIYQWCQDHKLDFDVVYTQANQTYNEGYEKLNHPEYKKYILQHQEGEIGGHCIIPNCELLDSNIAKDILEFNKML